MRGAIAVLFLLLYAGVPIEAQQQSGFPIDTHVFAGGIVANETGTLKEYGASFFSGAAWADRPNLGGFQLPQPVTESGRARRLERLRSGNQAAASIS